MDTVSVFGETSAFVRNWSTDLSGLSHKIRHCFYFVPSCSYGNKETSSFLEFCTAPKCCRCVYHPCNKLNGCSLVLILYQPVTMKCFSTGPNNLEFALSSTLTRLSFHSAAPVLKVLFVKVVFACLLLNTKHVSVPSDVVVSRRAC